MNPSVINSASIELFKNNLQGPLLAPGENGYDEARSVWNGMIDRRPALIACCESVDDVIASVRFAKENGLITSVKGGGHGVAGKAVCEDGLMIDLSHMNSVSVDSVAQTVRVGPGAKLGDLDKETQKYNLFTTGGIVSTTGVAGLTLGGGIGYLARKFGLTLDNLLSVDMVTAEGELVAL